mgnify:CR=1 FL=1
MLSPEVMAAWAAANAQLVQDIREEGHATSGNWLGRQALLLTTTGAKSGQERMSPLAYSTDGGQTFTTAAPANAGHYEVFFTFDGEAHYQAVATPTDRNKAVDIRPATTAAALPSQASRSAAGHPEPSTAALSAPPRSPGHLPRGRDRWPACRISRHDQIRQESQSPLST